MPIFKIGIFVLIYTLWISRCLAAARTRIPGSIDNSVTGVSAANLKDDGDRQRVVMTT